MYKTDMKGVAGSRFYAGSLTGPTVRTYKGRVRSTAVDALTTDFRKARISFWKHHPSAAGSDQARSRLLHADAMRWPGAWTEQLTWTPFSAAFYSCGSVLSHSHVWYGRRRYSLVTRRRSRRKFANDHNRNPAFPLCVSGLACIAARITHDARIEWAGLEGPGGYARPDRCRRSVSVGINDEWLS